jgi:hypothetical protein
MIDHVAGTVPEEFVASPTQHFRQESNTLHSDLQMHNTPKQILLLPQTLKKLSNFKARAGGV